MPVAQHALIFSPVVSLWERKAGGGSGDGGGGLGFILRPIASSRPTSGAALAVRAAWPPGGTKPPLIKSDAVTRSVVIGPRYCHRLGVRFLWGHSVGGSVSEMLASTTEPSLSKLQGLDVYLVNFFV